MSGDGLEIEKIAVCAKVEKSILLTKLESIFFSLALFISKWNVSEILKSQTLKSANDWNIFQ